MLPSFRFVKHVEAKSIGNGFQDNTSRLRLVFKAVLGLLTIQIASTVLVQRLVGLPPYDATNTDFLCRKSIVLFLCLFLSIQYDTIPGFLLGCYNTYLLAVILQHSTIRWSKMSKLHLLGHVASFASIVGMRVWLGYLFSRGTGWATPSLFFNDSIHETTYGLTQVNLYCISLQAYGCLQMKEDSHLKSSWRLPFLWLPNIFRGPIFFWSFSTVSVTGIHGLWHVFQISNFCKPDASLFRDNGRLSPSSESEQQQINSRLSKYFTILRTFLGFVAASALISLGHSAIYQLQHRSRSPQVSDLPESTLLDFLIISYPRPSDFNILSSTLETYVEHLGSRISATVYTTAPEGTHETLIAAMSSFGGLSELGFHQDKSPDRLPYNGELISGYLPTKQTFDLYSALFWMERNSHSPSNQTRYIGIMEDDFEWCRGSWEDLTAVMYEVSVREQQTGVSFCGLFIATGGSGLLVRPTTLPLLRQALQDHAAELNTDVILQKCLLGELKSCTGCKLAASRRMLLRHSGAMASTYENRSYPGDRWQCGWRQPFNGYLGVWVP